MTATNTFGASGLLSRRVGTASTFYTFDPMGNVAQRYTSTGSLVSSDYYDSFGSATSTATPSDPFGYEGQFGYYTEHGTSLILCGHRFYDTSTGRFINRDPIGYAGGINLYGYAGNNAVNAVDPSGFKPGMFTIGDGGGDGGETADTDNPMPMDVVPPSAPPSGYGGGGGGEVGGGDGTVSCPEGDAAEGGEGGGSVGGGSGGGGASDPNAPFEAHVPDPEAPDAFQPRPFNPNGPSGGSPALDGDPYNPDAVNGRNNRPPYKTNDAHKPGANFNPQKSVEPPDGESVYSTATRSDWHVYWGEGQGGWYRYFYDDTTGYSHFSGVFNAKNPVVPNFIKNP